MPTPSTIASVHRRRRTRRGGRDRDGDQHERAWSANTSDAHQKSAFAGRVHRREVEAEPDAASSASPTPAATRRRALVVLERRKDDADERAARSRRLRERGRSPVAIPKMTGMIAETPAIGATTLIAPVAMPR